MIGSRITPTVMTGINGCKQIKTSCSIPTKTLVKPFSKFPLNDATQRHTPKAPTFPTMNMDHPVLTTHFRNEVSETRMTTSDFTGFEEAKRQ